MDYPPLDLFARVMADLRRAPSPAITAEIRKYVALHVKRDNRDLQQELLAMAAPGAQQLANDGLLPLPPTTISPQLEAGLTAHPWCLQGTLGLVDAPAQFSLDQRPAEAAEIAITDQHAVANIPGILELANDPAVLSAIAQYFMAPPTLINFVAFRSRPGNVESVNSFFHQDRDDFQFVKLGIYLTDVGPENGPHDFIKGTHDWHKMQAHLQAQHRKTPNEVMAFAHWLDKQSTRAGAPFLPSAADALFPGARTTITGAAGTRFIVDTKGLHRGITPTAGERMCVFFTYGLLPDDRVAYPRKPFAELAAETRNGVLSDWASNRIKRYVNRLYVS